MLLYLAAISAQSSNSQIKLSQVFYELVDYITNKTEMKLEDKLITQITSLLTHQVCIICIIEPKVSILSVLLI